MKIMFCCTGNTCRSPMAEKILIHQLKEADIHGIEVSSSGIFAQEWQQTNHKSIIALMSMGVPAKVSYAKQLTKNSLEQSDLVVCMTEEHKFIINNLYGFNEKVVSPRDIDSSLEDIGDPYGYENDTYLEVSRQISKLIKALIDNKLSKMQ